MQALISWLCAAPPKPQPKAVPAAPKELVPKPAKAAARAVTNAVKEAPSLAEKPKQAVQETVKQAPNLAEKLASPKLPEQAPTPSPPPPPPPAAPLTPPPVVPEKPKVILAAFACRQRAHARACHLATSCRHVASNGNSFFEQEIS